MDKNSLFKIGYVSRTHGLKGEVTVVLNADAPVPGKLKVIFVELDGSFVPHFVENTSGKGATTFIKFEEIDSLESALGLKGGSLFIEKSKRPKLHRGNFYTDEIKGFEVIDARHGRLGTVENVIEHGPNRLIEVLFNKKEILIPANGPFIKSLNKSQRLIKVVLPEGFLDI